MLPPGREIWDPDPSRLSYSGDAQQHRQPFLQKDFSLSCNDAEHIRIEGFATFMLFVVALGLPMLYFYILYMHREDLMAGERKALEFFVRDYRPEWKYWEVSTTAIVYS